MLSDWRPGFWRSFWGRVHAGQLKEQYEYRNAPDLPEVVAPVFSEKTCDIVAYGAVGDGKISNTGAISEAISDCFVSGGGKVVVPAGRWLTGPIHLKSGINLFLAEGAEVIFSEKREEYLPVVFTRYQGMDYYGFSPLIYAKDCENIAITGKGRLIGNGKAWHDWSDDANSSSERERLFDMATASLPVEERIFGAADSGLRPSFVQFISCKNILLEDFHIEEGPHWTIHPIYSENILMQRINIDTEGLNTDGIALDSSRNIVIRDTKFSTGDDAISIKSGLEAQKSPITENVLIENCEATKGHSAVAIGSELSGGVKNIIIRNNKFISTEQGLRIKTTRTRGGFVDGVWFEKNQLEGVEGEAVLVVGNYESELAGEKIQLTKIKNIFISEIKNNNGDNHAISISASERGQVENFHVRNFNSSSRRGIYVQNAGEIFATDLVLKTKKLPLFEIENSEDIYINNVDCAEKVEDCVVFEGESSENIMIDRDTNITKERVKAKTDPIQSGALIFL